MHAWRYMYSLSRCYMYMYSLSVREGLTKFFDSKNYLYLHSPKILHFFEVLSSNFCTAVLSMKPLLEAMGLLYRSVAIETVYEGLEE